MVEHTTETEILERAVNAFREATGLNLYTERIERTDPRWRNVDAKVRLVAPGVEKHFAVEVKRLLNQTSLGLATQQLARLPEQGLLVAEYVNVNLAERLKQMNIPFLDTVGNAYFNIPPVFIYAKGQKGPLKTYQERPTRAFHPALLIETVRDLLRVRIDFDDAV